MVRIGKALSTMPDWMYMTYVRPQTRVVSSTDVMIDGDAAPQA